MTAPSFGEGLPLFAAFKALSGLLREHMKLDDLPWLTRDLNTLLGTGHVQPLKPRDGNVPSRTGSASRKISVFSFAYSNRQAYSK
jgi:hypothetical protein